MSAPTLVRLAQTGTPGSGIRQVASKYLAADFSTGNGFLTDVTGLSITIVTKASQLLTLMSVGFDNTVNNTGNRFLVDVDGSNALTLDMESTLTGLGKGITLSGIVSVAAGSHTIKARTLVSGGIVTWFSSGGIGTNLTVLELGA